jgi:hypothetical protein
MTQAMTAIDGETVREWAQRAQIGDKMVYYVGDLSHDTRPAVRPTEEQMAAALPLIELRQAVQRLYTVGMVNPHMRRLTDAVYNDEGALVEGGAFEYTITRRKLPKAVDDWFIRKEL